MKAASRSEGPGDTAYWVEGFSEKTKMTQDLDEDGDYSAHAEDEDDTTHARWRALFSFTRQSHTLTLIIAIVLSIVSGVIIPATSIFLGLAFNAFTDFGAGQLSGHELLHKVSIQSIALVALGGANWALTGGHFMFWLVFGELQAQSVRDRLFDGLMEKDMSWYDMRKNGVGALIPRLHSQIRELQMATSQPLGFVVQYSVTAAAALGVAFYYSWNLTLVTLATVPFAGLMLSFISARMQPSIEAQQEHLSVASKYASHAISAIDTVKCYNGQDHETWHFACAIRRAARCYLVQARANALQIGFVRLVILSMFVQGFWYGSTLVGPGGKNSGQIVTTFWSALMATQSIEQILPQMLVLEKGRAAGATLKAVGMRIERGRRVTSMAGNFVPSHCCGDIEFRDVSFAYPLRPDRMALQKASFFFPAGETTFVVGQSGSGKSTLGNLLLRYYSGWSGHVAIDGTAIQTLDLTWLRNNVTLVQQQSVLFNESLWTNITFGCKTRLNITRTDVRKACQVALLQHTINDLPDGLETLVGSRGSSMSGGQRQRVAIARARLRDTPILILDESTSALDYVSRSLVMDAIRDWRRGKTTIIITHDMTQVFEDDYVYVLDKGEVSQEGYRGSLEKQAAGPFSRSKKHGADPRSPTWGDETTQRDSSDMDTQPASIATVPSPPRLSQMSRDSLDIEVAPRRPHVPHGLGAGSDDWPLPRVPLSILSPPPLVTHPGNDMSDVELVELTGRSATLHGRSTSDGLTPISSSRPLNPKSARLNESQNLAKAARAHTKTMSSLKKILGTVWPTLDWKRRIVLLLGFVSAFLHAAATPTFSYLFAQLLATFHAQGNGSQPAVKWSLSVLAVAISDAIFSYLMHYLLEYSAQAWVDMLRIEALKRMLSQPRTWFDDEKNSVSRLSECLDRNAEEMRNLIGRFAGFVFVAFAMTSMAIIWSFIVSWKLTIVGLASAPAMYAVTRGFEFVSGIWEGKSNDAAEAAASIFTETFTSIRVVRALTLERHFGQKYAKATGAALKIGLRRAAYSGLFYGLSGSGILFVMALLFYYGALLASAHQFTITEILTVFSLLIFSIANANATLSFVPQINSSRDTATRLLRLANLPLTSHELRGTTRLVTPLPIILRELSFSYPSRPTHTVLDSLNLHIPPNSTTAIVGPSGSGKTTLASVLLGLHAPTSRPASLTFAHQPCSSVHTGSLRAHIGYVAQAPVLFPGTLASNIAYPLAEAALAQAHVERAARLAGIHDFVASLPAGYATSVLPDGAGSGGGLSGGQAQRVAIARALLRRPRLLLLDEPTSSLDPAAAALVRDALRRLRADRPGLAVVLVTHQPDMMRAADRIVVLERGRIVQVGRWSELMAVHGPFRNMMNRGVWEGGRRRGGEGEGEGGTA